MQSCKDGYLRMPIGSLRQLELRHLCSGLDETHAHDHIGGCGTLTYINGYTEWVCLMHLGLSIGWDWIHEVQDGLVTYARNGFPYSNLMLMDESHRDIGKEGTLALLASTVDTILWQEATRLAIVEKYGI